jgi:hypothetical protein
MENEKGEIVDLYVASFFLCNCPGFYGLEGGRRKIIRARSEEGSQDGYRREKIQSIPGPGYIGLFT